MDSLERKLTIAYIVTVAALLAASWLPDQRLWAFNLWGYLPFWFRWVASGLALLFPVLWYIAVGRRSSNINKGSESSRHFVVIGLVTSLALTALFIAVRLRTYFLGDGYVVLSLLSDNNPFVKFREVGEAYIHILVKNMLGEGRPAALLSFQIISIGAGFLYAVGASLLASRLFERTIDRVIFLFGVLSGGYILLFFGYVENYSLFVLGMTAYTGLALMVFQKQLNPVWAVVGSIGCTLIHIMGITTLPSAIYLLLRNTRLGRWFGDATAATKAFAVLILLIAAGTVITYFHQTIYFFRFALVPFREDRFTLDGYTLFSADHIIDMLNLAFILCPGILILVVVIQSLGIRRLLRQPVNKYLLVLIVSVVGAVFIFDPKLGMARDWDLFAFAGAAGVMGGVFVLAGSKLPDRSKVLAVLLMVCLGVISVGSRLAIYNNDASATARFLYLCELDHTKGRAAEGIVIDYYAATQRPSEARLAKERWNKLYPQNLLIQEGRDLVNKGMTAEGIAKLKRVIEIDPGYYGAWANLARAHNAVGRYYEALEYGKIAAGLNPWESRNYNNIASSCFYLGMYDESEKYYYKALSHISDSAFVLRNLLTLYKDTKQIDKYLATADLLIASDKAPVDLIKMLADYHLQRGLSDSAAVLYEMALAKGLDTQAVLDVMQRYPLLRVRGVEP